MQRLHPPKSVAKVNKQQCRRSGWRKQWIGMLLLCVVWVMLAWNPGWAQPTSPQPAPPAPAEESKPATPATAEEPTRTNLAPPLPLESPRLSTPGEEGYRYNDQGRRDPLEPLVKEPRRDELIPVGVASDRPLSILERFDVSAMKLIAVVWGDLGRRALVRTPDGKSHFVTLDTYMGKYGGRVVAIENDHVVIEELYKDLDDKIVSKTLTLPLRRKDEKEG